MEGPTKDPGLGNPWLTYAREHPLRAQLLALVDEQRLEPAELAKALDQSLAVVAYHREVLETAGLL